MRLLTVDTIQQAQEKMFAYMDYIKPKTEKITLDNAFGRVLAQDAVSEENIPDFYRSTVDGYAVKAADTQGSSESIPTFLRIVEEVQMGKASTRTITSGECAYVPTGGMVPDGADAVVMVEYTEVFGIDEVAIYQSTAKGKCVVVPGEDVKAGDTIVKKGTCLKAEHIGALAAAGIWEIEVFIPWKVTIVSTGNELVQPYEKLGAGQVRDVNTWAIKALAEQSGMCVVNCLQIKDNEQDFRDCLNSAKLTSDIVLTSGGSSQGKADMTEAVMDEVCDEGTFTHGLSIKPGKPTILAFDKASSTLMVGLPGHPVSALTVFQRLVVHLWAKATNQPQQQPIVAKMETNLAGSPGKATHIMVKLDYDMENAGFIAKPVLGKSGLINTMVNTDGFIVIDMNKEGLKKGEAVLVYRWGV